MRPIAPLLIGLAIIAFVVVDVIAGSDFTAKSAAGLAVGGALLLFAVLLILGQTRPTYVQLVAPTFPISSFQLPAVGVLRNPRWKGQYDAFADAVATHLRTGQYGPAANRFADDLLSPVPRPKHEGLRPLMAKAAEAGLAVASEEQARSWARPGMSHPVVSAFMSLLGAFREVEPPETGHFLDFVFRASYFYARSGNGLPAFQGMAAAAFDAGR